MPSEERDAERCPVAAENTDGAYYCTRKRGHDGPCAAVPTERERIRQDLSETVTTAIHKTMERDAEMLGVPVWRHPTRDPAADAFSANGLQCRDCEPGRWYAEPVAVAMVEAVEAARAYRAFAQPRQHTMTPETIAEWHRIKDALYGSLDNLDAALGGWTE